LGIGEANAFKKRMKQSLYLKTPVSTWLDSGVVLRKIDDGFAMWKKKPAYP
jgi:hypothetical protein